MKSLLAKIFKWRPNWKNLLRDFIILVLILIVLDFWQRRNLIEGGKQIDTSVLNLTDTDLEAKEWTSGGKPSILYFFAPWCGVCKFSMNDLHSKLDTFGLTEKMNLKFVALDYADTESVQNFRHDIKQPILFGQDFTRDYFEIEAYPTIYILDKENRVVSHRVGYTPAWLIYLKSLMVIWGGY